MNNQQYHDSITALLQASNWEQVSSGRAMVVWKKQNNKSIQLPSEEFINDELAPQLYDKAIEVIAVSENSTIDSVIEALYASNRKTDVISIRTSGEGVPHGKISLFSGTKALCAISSLIKANAEKNSVAKKGFKKKLEEHYLESVNLLVPQAGSFIHKVEIDLTPFTAEEDSKPEKNNQIEQEPANRSINVKLAEMLIALQKIEPKSLKLTSLIKLGITEKISRSLIDSFTDEVDSVDYDFNWSPVHKEPGLETNLISFNRGHRETFKKIKKMFAGTTTFPIVNLEAHIDGYLTPGEGNSSLELRIRLEKRERLCEVIAERKVVEELMAEMSNDSTKTVNVTGKITKVIKNQKTSYFLSDAIISPSSSKQLNLLG
ncbi:hypothetical protein AB4463_11925 [Vibrio cyclitrophicus]